MMVRGLSFLFNHAYSTLCTKQMGIVQRELARLSCPQPVLAFTYNQGWVILQSGT